MENNNLNNKGKEKKLIKNTAILSFGTFCTKGIMFFMTPLFTRWLSQNDYGTFDLLSTYITLLIPFITLDIGEAAFRFLVNSMNNKKDNEENTEETKIISSSVIISIIGLIFSIIIIFIVSFFYQPMKEYLACFILLLICENLNNFITYIVRGFKRLPIYALSNILFVVSMCISSIITIFWLKMGLNGILISYSIGYILSIVFSSIKIKVLKYISLKTIDFKLIKKMLKFSLPLMPNAISWWIVNVSDRTIVSAVLGTSVNAVYAVSNKIPNLCQTFFGVFHLSWQENAIEVMNDKDKDIYYSSIMNNMIRILSSICICIMSINFLIYKILFKEEYFQGYFQVPILICSIILSMLAQFIGGIYIARMESKKNGITTLMAAIVNLIVHLLLIKSIGLYAATISTFISYLILFVIRYIDIKKNVDLKFNNKTLIILAIMIYYFISSYINNIVLNIFNIFVAVIIFIIINKKYFVSIFRKMIKKIRKEV